MKKYNVGILGATGAVGQEMMKILAERSFPIGELRLLASKKSRRYFSSFIIALIWMMQRGQNKC